MATENNHRRAVGLVIGIGAYLQVERIVRLPFAARDALALADVLREPAVCAFPPERVKLLVDEQARREEIVRHLTQWLPEAAQGAELVVLYFAGHGLVRHVGPREEGFLLPYDGDPHDPVTSGLALSDLARWLQGIEAAVRVVCLDCCHGGQGIRPSVLQSLAGQGRFLLTSCAEGQVSLEAEEVRHGLLTYHLVKGIEGAADSDGDGQVGITELFAYVGAAVARESRTRYGREQKPWTHAAGPEGAYLSRPPVPQAHLTGPHGPKRRWRGQGVQVALPEIERCLADADDAKVTDTLRQLRWRADAASIPLLFRCLGHPSATVRTEAQRAVRVIGWERTASYILDLARRGDEAGMGDVLGGLTAFEAHAQTVSLLERLVPALKGRHRNRAIFLLEQKRLSLTLDEVVTLFCDERPYQIRKALGQGLFTATYLGCDESMGLEVAIRVLRPELAKQPHLRDQFLDLSRRSVPLVHHNLVLTREVRACRERSLYYTVRDYIAGTTLQKVLESGKQLEALQVCGILRQVLAALTPLHRLGSHHGGIKPSNIFLGDDDRVVLGDAAMPMLGIAGARHRLAYDFRYVPPEMFAGGDQLGPASDLYSLGCVTYELLCGRPPFVSDSYFELAGKHTRGAVEAPSLRGSTWGPAGDALLRTLLAKDPVDRPRGIAEVRRAVDALEETLRQQAEKVGPSADAADKPALSQYVPKQSILSFQLDETPLPAAASTPEPDPPPGAAVAVAAETSPESEPVPSTAAAAASEPNPEPSALPVTLFCQTGSSTETSGPGPLQDPAKEPAATPSQSTSPVNETALPSATPAPQPEPPPSAPAPEAAESSAEPELPPSATAAEASAPSPEPATLPAAPSHQAESSPDMVELRSLPDSGEESVVTASQPVSPAVPAQPCVAPAAAAVLDSQDGVSVGAGYKLVKRIGSGGFGEVWRAEAPGGIELAIKIAFRPLEHEDSRREVEALDLIKRLRHVYLLQTLAFWWTEERLLIAMELADGSLRDRLTECRRAGLAGIPLAELITYFLEAAEALDYLHSQHVLHRDVKPDNILLLNRHAKVSDFGLARALPQMQRSVLVNGSGTPAYMAPEVWHCKDGAHSDQYALACTYAELRLGRRLFASEAPRAIMLAHLYQSPNLEPLPRAEQDVLLRALAKNPRQRFPSCLAFARALHDAVHAASSDPLPASIPEPAACPPTLPPSDGQPSAAIWKGPSLPISPSGIRRPMRLTGKARTIPASLLAVIEGPQGHRVPGEEKRLKPGRIPAAQNDPQADLVHTHLETALPNAAKADLKEHAPSTEDLEDPQTIQEESDGSGDSAGRTARTEGARDQIRSTPLVGIVAAVAAAVLLGGSAAYYCRSVLKAESAPLSKGAGPDKRLPAPSRPGP